MRGLEIFNINCNMRTFKNNKLPYLEAKRILGEPDKYLVINKDIQEFHFFNSFEIENNEDWDEVQSDWIELDPTINN